MKNVASDNFLKIVEVIKKGEVAILPTDTIYGLSALAENKNAVNRIYKIKKRKKQKPLIVLMRSLSMVGEYCYLNKKQYDFINKELRDGKILTIILKNKSSKLNHLTNKKGGLSVRIPRKSRFLINLIRKIKKPIVSTSLNLAGCAPILDLKKIQGQIDEKNIGFILNIGKIKKARPSKIIDITDIENIEIIRR